MQLVGIGSNVGDRRTNIELAMAEMKKKGVQILTSSSLYETPPWGIQEQDAFFNSVVRVSFDRSAEELLRILLEIEVEMGRIREVKWGPRLIDLDILEFNSEQIQSEELTVPHPWYTTREFVLIPLREIAPDFIPTGGSKTILELMDELPDEKKEGIKAVYPASSIASSTSDLSE